jgi:hypothetical protein
MGMEPLNLEAQSKQSIQGLGNLIERITPWLFEVGSWIFGGLIAFNLVVIASLITVGPVDDIILVSITAFACALPLNVAGVFLLRMVKDMKEIAIDDLTLQAFQDAEFPDIEAYFPPAGERAVLYKRRSRVALRYALGIVLVSTALTLTGLVAAVWYMAWWVGVALLVMIILSTVLVMAVLAHSLPPASEAEKVLKRRYREQRHQQGREQPKTG